MDQRTVKGGGRREPTVLATKVYGTMADWPNDSKLSALNIRQALDSSLERLQTEHTDLHQFNLAGREHHKMKSSPNQKRPRNTMPGQ